MRYRISLNKKVFVTIEGKEVECEEEGNVIAKTIELDGKEQEFKILCPDPTHFIAAVKYSTCLNECSNNGYCVNGKCECFYGFTGLNCGEEEVNKL